MNGECNCRKSFSGKFCEIVEYIPDKTNYTMYLKYFLFFIIMALIISALLFGAWMMFKNADKIRQRYNERSAQKQEPAPEGQLLQGEEQDPDNLAGEGLGV